MTKATKRTIGVICLLWLGTLLLLFANYKTKVYLEQLRSQVDAVTQQEQANATAVKRQPSLTMEDVLVRTDAQLVTTSFSNENYAAKAKSLVSLCDKELKEKTGGVSNESVQAEMQRRPGMNGRLVIPSVGVNVALFDGHAQRFVDAKDSAAYFLAGNTMVVGDHWNQGFSKIKNCHAGTLAYIYRGTSVQTLTCTGVCSGINGDSDLLSADGSSATMGGGTLMYTCNLSRCNTYFLEMKEMNNKNNMKRLAVISLAVMGIMLVFAQFDAARMNREIKELQKTVNYTQLFEDMLFPNIATAETGETAETAESAAVADFAPVMNFEACEKGVHLSQESYLPLTLSDAKVFVPCADIEEPCTVAYRSEDSTAQAGAYRLALVKGDASNSIGEFQNGDETLLSGARNVSDDVYLTVAVTLDEEHRSEQVDAIKKLLANTVISDATPKVALFGETLADDVSLEISDSYMQLQKGTDTVLVSAFQQSIDTSLLSKSLTLPNGLTLKYGDVKDSQTGYIPFIATVDGHKYKFLATSSDILLNMFEE